MGVVGLTGGGVILSYDMEPFAKSRRPCNHRTRRFLPHQDSQITASSQLTFRLDPRKKAKMRSGGPGFRIVSIDRCAHRGGEGRGDLVPGDLSEFGAECE